MFGTIFTVWEEGNKGTIALIRKQSASERTMMVDDWAGADLLVGAMRDGLEHFIQLTRFSDSSARNALIE